MKKLKDLNEVITQGNQEFDTILQRKSTYTFEDRIHYLFGRLKSAYDNLYFQSIQQQKEIKELNAQLKDLKNELYKS